ncbi:2-phosphosulfolactate phosphatase [Lysinibacillus sp. LZ02]|uniref:2-phosphosulfolactate phosphatase n=1 Tax=Lysinibacillus sp. LZ02 TaxID=3420668 RepID=UPI003D36C823
MRKIHVIFNKELVEPSRLIQCSAVVVDVFLATTTITTLLAHDIAPVLAVENAEIAQQLSENLTEPVLLIGESAGLAIDNFMYPDPTLITTQLGRTQAIICSTNGTRAIQKAKYAAQLYISSLANGHAIAKALHEEETERSIVIIASGNNGRFSLEDCVGAGQIISYLLQLGNYELSDAAYAACSLYAGVKLKHFEPLLHTETVQLLKHLQMDDAVSFVIDTIESTDIVAVFEDEQIITRRTEWIS